MVRDFVTIISYLFRRPFFPLRSACACVRGVSESFVAEKVRRVTVPLSLRLLPSAKNKTGERVSASVPLGESKTRKRKLRNGGMEGSRKAPQPMRAVGRKGGRSSSTTTRTSFRAFSSASFFSLASRCRSTPAPQGNGKRKHGRVSINNVRGPSRHAPGGGQAKSQATRGQRAHTLPPSLS